MQVAQPACGPVTDPPALTTGASRVAAFSMSRGRDLRTVPLWGLRLLATFLHDGRATTIADAIVAHDGQGRLDARALRRSGPRSKARS